MFIKTEAVFLNNWNDNWTEVKLYRSMKELVLIVFSNSISQNQSLKLKSLTIDILTRCEDTSRSLKELKKKQTSTTNFITSKLHNISHYHQLIPKFGPLIYLATFHYEHKHQSCKNFARNVRNFDSIGLTVHRRHQQMLAMFELNSNFSSTNFYEEQGIDQRPMDELPKTLEQYEKIKFDDRPFKLKKAVVRKIKSSRFEWFYVTKFYKDIETREIFCEGQVMEVQRSSESSYHLPKLTPKTRKQHRVDVDVIQFVRLSNLHYKNDFLFQSESENLYLLKMSY